MLLDIRAHSGYLYDHTTLMQACDGDRMDTYNVICYQPTNCLAYLTASSALREEALTPYTAAH